MTIKHECISLTGRMGGRGYEMWERSKKKMTRHKQVSVRNKKKNMEEG
jgi:hypothetical protein